MGSPKRTTQRIAGIIGSAPLAEAIEQAIASALRCHMVSLGGGRTVWAVFDQSLKAAIRDVETHPMGKLFRRLIEYGPPDLDAGAVPTSDGRTTLSDPECACCVQFIYSHMVNRFKGELAELLALKPCMELIQRLKDAGRVPTRCMLFWGEQVQERCRRTEGPRASWGDFVKGADGLLAVCTTDGGVNVHGIIEIKSMPLPTADLLGQISSHAARLRGGLRLGTDEFAPCEVRMSPKDAIKVLVVPSTWKLSREHEKEPADNGVTKLLLPEPCTPPDPVQVAELKRNVWRITLDWSKEALEQAAYEMTFWYMSQVGASVYSTKPLPKGWEHMTPEEAGFNAIKMMMYYLPGRFRYLSKRHEPLAIRLYNVYSFGYPLGVDSREMMWEP